MKLRIVVLWIFLYPSQGVRTRLEGSPIGDKQANGLGSDAQVRDDPSRSSALDSKVLDELEFDADESVPESSRESDMTYSFEEIRAEHYHFGLDYVTTATDPNCTPTTAVCIPDRRDWAKHFAHTAQRLLPCFSVLNRLHSNMSWVVVQEGVEKDRAKMSSWNADLLKAMHIEVRDNTTGLECKVTSTVRHCPGSYCLHGVDDALDLHRNMGLSRGISGKSAVNFSVGIFNRAGSRHWSGASRFIDIASQEFPNAKFQEAYFDNMTFKEQAHWVNSLDLIISPHGAGETNLLFARRCTGVIELSPENYYIPGWFAGLANAVGAQFYGGYPEGRNGWTDTQAKWDCCRAQMRAAPIFARPDSVLSFFKQAVAQQARCYQRSADASM